MFKKVLLNETDYEIYTFVIPKHVYKKNPKLAFLFSRKLIKKWIITHLEKVHPCFYAGSITLLYFILQKTEIEVFVLFSTLLNG